MGGNPGRNGNPFARQLRWWDFCRTVGDFCSGVPELLYGLRPAFCGILYDGNSEGTVFAESVCPVPGGMDSVQGKLGAGRYRDMGVFPCIFCCVPVYPQPAAVLAGAGNLKCMPVPGIVNIDRKNGMEAYIEIDHVTKKFGDDIILHGISICMERGKVYGISGNNGSGKTVLMKCICGFLPVTEGSIRVNGKYIGPEIDFPESIGVIIETPGFLTNLSGMRNLEILAGLKGKITKEEIREAIRKAGLDPDLKKAVAKYSLGMRQRLGIAQAIMEDPEFLILDEPFNGLDKHGVGDIRKLLLELKQQGKTIILASHNSEDIRILCDEVYEMDGGRMFKI